MKSLFLITSLFTLPVFAVTREQSAQHIIKTFGYVCDTVDSIQPFVVGEGFHVYCNNFRYHFEIRDVGGKIIVNVK